MERLTYHFILLSIFYRCTEQTSNALLTCIPCVFILHKNKTKTSPKLWKEDVPPGCCYINYLGQTKPLIHSPLISWSARAQKMYKLRSSSRQCNIKRLVFTSLKIINILYFPFPHFKFSKELTVILSKVRTQHPLHLGCSWRLKELNKKGGPEVRQRPPLHSVHRHRFHCPGARTSRRAPRQVSGKTVWRLSKTQGEETPAFKAFKVRETALCSFAVRADVHSFPTELLGAGDHPLHKVEPCGI